MLWLLPISLWYAIACFFAVYFIRKQLNKRGVAPLPLKVASVLELLVAGTGFIAINDLRRAYSAFIIVLVTRFVLQEFYDENVITYWGAFVICAIVLYKKCSLKLVHYLQEASVDKGFSFGKLAPLNYDNVKRFVAKSYIPETMEVQQQRLADMKTKIQKGVYKERPYEKALGKNYHTNQKSVLQMDDTELIAQHRLETFPIYALIESALEVPRTRSQQLGANKSISKWNERDDLDDQMEEFQHTMNRSQDEAFQSFHDEHRF